MSLPLTGASLLEFTSWSQNTPSPFLGSFASPSLPLLSSHSHFMHDRGIPRVYPSKVEAQGEDEEHSRGQEGGGRGSVAAVFINSWAWVHLPPPHPF